MSKRVEGASLAIHKFAWTIPLLLTIVVAVPVCLQIHNLGIYPDAVNPDYLAIRMLHKHADTVAWVLPGNYLGNRFPVLAGGLYHGSLHAYLALPFILFGASVESFQISHLFLAFLVATVLFALLRRLSGSLALATAVCALALLDPAFLYIFFTQAYITTFPDFFILLACHLLLNDTETASVKGRYFCIGGLLGLAIWGYFIFTFFLPGFFSLPWIERRRGDATLGKILFLGLGVACGCGLYGLGYGLLFHELGLQGGFDWLSEVLGNMRQLQVTSGSGLVDRLAYTSRMTLFVLTGAWHATTIFAVGDMSVFEMVKAGVLLVTPIAALPFAGGDALAARGFRVIGIALLSFWAVALGFGHMLAGHHYCALVPILYCLFGASLVLLGQRITLASRGLRTSALGGLLAAVAAINVFYLETFSWRIYNGESARLYSHEVNAYPSAERKRGGAYTHVFMNWGEILPFVYLTKGKMPVYDDQQLPALLCESKPLKLLFTKDNAVELAKATLDRLKLTGTIELLSPPANPYQFVVATVEAPTTPRCGG